MLTHDLRNRFHPLSIGAHWLTLILLLAAYALIELRGLAPKGGELRDAMKTWHYAVGLTVFAIAGLRLVLLPFTRTPPIVPEPTPWQRGAARAMHVALYAFLIAMPLLGRLALSAKGTPVAFFGWELPALIGRDRPLARNLKDIHELIGTLGYFLIGTHALAALFRHHVMRDNTLRRMSPW